MIKAGLIDEFHLFINPTAIGTGRAIFKDINEIQKFTMIKTTPFDCGIVELHCEPKTLKSVEEDKPNWKNVRILSNLNHDTITKLKEEGNGVITILGSGSIIQQLANMDFIDEYEIVVVPSYYFRRW